MSQFAKEIAIRFQERPVGFKKQLEKELQEKLDFDTPHKTGKMEGNNKIRVKLDSVLMSNNTAYAKYVEKSGPRSGGKGKKRWFASNANSANVNSIARSVRDTLKKKMAQRKKKRGK